MNFSGDPAALWLLRTTVEGAGLIFLVLGLRRVFPGLLTPGWRIALWCVVGVKLLVPASLPIGLGFGSVLSAGSSSERTPSVVQAGESGRARAEFQPPGGSAPVPSVGAERIDVARLALGLWAAGGLMVLACLVFRERRFRCSLRRLPSCEDRELLALLRECAPFTPEVRLLPDGSGPAVAGLFAPVLLLPGDWRVRFDRDSLRHVIFHELEHVRSRDLVWNWIAALITAVHWFNPLVWFAASRFQADRELRCDARALERMGPTDRVAYGRTLLRISETFLAPPATAGLAPCVRNHPSLRHRITMITRPPTPSPMLHAFSAGVLGLLVCLSFGTARAQEEPGKDRAAEAKRDREKPREGEAVRDGERPKEGERMRDGGKPRSGPRDGEVPRTGPRDGEVPRTGPRDGDAPRTGARDEGGPKPEAGRRRDGETREVREGAARREAGAPIEIRVLGQGDDVKIAGQTVPTHQLRGFLQSYLADKRGQPVVIDADPTTPYSAVAGVLDAARDNGAKSARIRGAAER